MDFKRFFEVNSGSVPIIFSSPHGGYKKPKILADKISGVMIADKVTYLISKRIIDLLYQEKIKIYYIISKIHRSKIDLNRPPISNDALNQETKSKERARKFHSYYHNQLKVLVENCRMQFQKCLLIDFHGFTKPHDNYPDIIFGNIFGHTLNINKEMRKKSGEIVKLYWGYTELKNQLSSHFKIDDGLGFNNYNLAYSGGYITHQFYEKENVNAFQLEVAKYIRRDIKLLNIFVDDFIKAIKETLNNA